ncbi:histone deacetylase clr3 [Coprinopsis cinerea okayama7|uniref:histone deacetylase n=1 Tax=Coprinopsis cinerea (strain Okayama-7 / 130 / ATCC MYA-4618 / FGSC 9003) TaxID=240176 RepID=D6RLC0_COPC7|nr:histone deacetylase clr3 [Coprinopsis cinerea okayama7\|eukprot:XP_002911602.1 histone deacetylase clr3 [Coprinopsis cinerea okayama7\
MSVSQLPQLDSMDVDNPLNVRGPSTSTNADSNIAGPSNLTRYLPNGLPRASSLPVSFGNLSVGYVYSADMMQHFNEEGHPEQPARIKRIWDLLVAKGLTEKMRRIDIRKVKKEEAMLVHSEDHWDKVIQLQYMDDQQRLDSAEYYERMSLYVMKGTTPAALLSCGGVIEASLAVARGLVQKSFAIVRPPGHHAEPDEHMGFCFFNNVAVAARVVQQLTPLKKILILDWDVHHGNGTQRAFDDDPSVLYMSIHRYESGHFYPCGPFGSLESCGKGPGEGFSVNVPWPRAGMEDADYLYAFQKVIMPIAMEFAPDLVIISAGFDAADGDDLGECHVTPKGYAHMTHMLAGLAGGKMVVALEGGYNLDAISDSALAVTEILLGQAPPQIDPMIASEDATETVWLVAKHLSRYWKSLDPKACEPREQVEEISYSIPEILKAHRQHYLYTNHDMMEIPLMTAELDQRFSSQVMCTPDMLDNDTIVLFVHEFGNLRIELESSATCDVNLHRSYLVDFSKELISWIDTEQFALIDANLFPKPTEIQQTRRATLESDLVREVILYLWDNYIQLSKASRVILIGHGPGCRAVAELLTRRATGVMKLVTTVIQIVGLQHSACAPTGFEDIRTWYKSHSAIILPDNHPMSSGRELAKEIRKHGRMIYVEETQPLKLVMKALPAVQQIIRESNPPRPDANGIER